MEHPNNNDSYRFLQLHLLTSYPPANLNRDNLGRPKTAWFGGRQRLRVSSQCLKRNWRTSEIFKNTLNGSKALELSTSFKKALGDEDIKIHPHIGVRTKDMGIAVFKWLEAEAQEIEEADTARAGTIKKNGEAWTQEIAKQFGKPKSKHKPKSGEEKKEYQHFQIEQLVHFSPEEIQAINDLVQNLIDGKKDKVEGTLLRKQHQAVDIRLFGRMLADSPGYNAEAAVQVAHAITVHEAEPEDDYFTAVDDLNLSPETGEAGTDKGAGHVDDAEFGAGLFYLYICVDRHDLKCNLKKEKDPDPEELTKKALRALTEAAVKVTPSGKRNSFGHHTYAHYVLAERGHQQPRGLHVAFLDPVNGKTDWLEQARLALSETCKKMDNVYDACANDRYVLDFANDQGSMKELLEFVTGDRKGNKPISTNSEEAA